MNTYTTKEMIEILEANGYHYLIAAKGDHLKFYNKKKRKSVTIPDGRKDLNPALCAGIIKREKLNVYLVKKRR